MSAPAPLAALVLLLGRLERLNESLVAEVCSSRGVSPGEFRVLAMLRHGGPEDGVRPTEISRWVVQTSGGLTATLHRLERDGRAERVPDPRDGRGRLVSVLRLGLGPDPGNRSGYRQWTSGGPGASGTRAIGLHRHAEPGSIPGIPGWTKTGFIFGT